MVCRLTFAIGAMMPQSDCAALDDSVPGVERIPALRGTGTAFPALVTPHPMLRLPANDLFAEVETLLVDRARIGFFIAHPFVRDLRTVLDVGAPARQGTGDGRHNGRARVQRKRSDGGVIKHRHPKEIE